MTLPELSIKRPVFATVLSLVLVLVGLVSYDRLSVREYPAIDPPVITVETTYPGAGAAIVETQVTKVLEDTLSGIEGIDYITSISRQESSQITVRFQLNRDPDYAAADVRDRVGRVRGRLPDEIEEPIIQKREADAQPILYIAFSSDRHSALEITDYADRYVKDQLQTIPGVAEVRLFGERQYSMRIWLDPERLAAFNLSPQDVEVALRRQNVEVPSGRVESQQREFTVLSETDLRTPEQFNDLIIKEANGYLVRLADVGRAELGPLDERLVVRFNGKPAIALGVIKQATANPLEVAAGVQKLLPEIRSNLPQGMEVRWRTTAPSSSPKSIKNVYKTIGEAILLVALDHLSVLALNPGDAGAARHHSGVADRRLRHHVCLRFLHQHAHAARTGAGDRPRSRRRHRHAREHLSPRRGECLRSRRRWSAAARSASPSSP